VKNNLVNPHLTRIAPFRKRLFASAVDGLPVLALFLPFVRRRPGPRQTRLQRSVNNALKVAQSAYEMLALARRGQTMGQRVAGIRVVDEHTGGAPTLKQAAVRGIVLMVPDVLSRLIFASQIRKHWPSLDGDLRAEVEQLRREHAGDPVALKAATNALFLERGVEGWAGCWPSLVVVVLNYLVRGHALLPPLHRSLADRLAGTVLIRSD